MGNIDLTRTLESYLKSLRPKWQKLKTKHAGAIKAKKLNFNQGLGPLLDNRIGYYKTIRNTKYGSASIGTKLAFRSLKSNSAALEKIINKYKVQAAKLDEPAKTEVTDLLDELFDEAVKVDKEYVKL